MLTNYFLHNSYSFLSSFIFSYLLVSVFLLAFSLPVKSFFHVSNTPHYFTVLLYLKPVSSLHNPFLKSVYPQSHLSQFSVLKVFQSFTTADLISSIINVSMFAVSLYLYHFFMFVTCLY